MKKRMLYKLLCVVICISVMCGCGTMKHDETNKEASNEEMSEISELEDNSHISKDEKGITKQENELGERIYTGETPAQTYAEIAEVYYQMAVEMLENGTDFEMAKKSVDNAYVCSNFRFQKDVEDIPIYLLQDLNGDGVDEFFVGIRTVYSNLDYIHYSICDVYTWKNGQAYQLMRDIGYRNGSCILCENGIIKDEYVSSAFEGETLFHILPVGATKLETVDSTSFSITQYEEHYYHGEEKITKEKHLELLEEYSEIVPEYSELTAEAISFLKEKEDKIALKCFTQEEIDTMPEVVIYSFADAYEKGMTQEIKGGLPGLAEGLWYVIVIDGIEYIFCEYENDEPFLCAYSIISDKYSLANGLSVGLTREDVFEMYPEMVEMDFEGNYLGDEIPNWGWNSASYPCGVIVADENQNNINNTFLWEEQFDYVILGAVDGEIHLGEYELYPIYIGLLMKDEVIKAITFYDPTAN